MQTYFSEEAPGVERRGAYIFVLPTYGDHQVAMPIHAMRKFVRRAAALLAEFDAEQRVVPMRKSG